MYIKRVPDPNKGGTAEITMVSFDGEKWQPYGELLRTRQINVTVNRYKFPKVRAATTH